MARAVLTELFHLVAGVVLTATLFEAAAWAYPIGATTIRTIGWATIAIVLVMAVGPLARAWRGSGAPSRSLSLGIDNA